MDPKGSRLALLAVLCVAAACLPHSTANTPYDKFLKRHLDFPKSQVENEQNYCTVLMGRRSIRCQPRNTFLHASEAQLRAVCHSGASQGPEVRDSQGAFPLTVCTRRPKGQCLYQGTSATARIRLACRQGLPAEYLRRL